MFGNLRELVEAVEEVQEGNSLRKYLSVERTDLIYWSRFKEIRQLTTCGSLDLLLLKALSGESPLSDVRYAINQLEAAKAVLVTAGYED